jgi:hypothetical protein
MTDESFGIYGPWQVTRWETPLSDSKDLLLEGLSEGKSGLSIEFCDHDREYAVSFPPFCCYRSINESFRNKLWLKLKEAGQQSLLGNSWIVDKSDFLEMLRDDPAWLSQNPEAKHYIFATVEDVIEVVSNVEPSIAMRVSQ